MPCDVMKNLKPILPILLTLVGLGVGFFGGIEYKNYQQKKMVRNFTTGTGVQRFNRNGSVAGAETGGMMFRGGLLGSILILDDSSMTVRLTDGSTKLVLFSDSTKYANNQTGVRGDLVQGLNVVVFGTPNSDGSVTATDIQLNPELGRPQPSPSPSGN